MKIKLSWEVEACISVQIKFCFILKEEQCGCGNGGEGGSKGKGENYSFPSCFLFHKGYKCSFNKHQQSKDFKVLWEKVTKYT